MQLTFWHRARYWVLLLLVFLITISSHPVIVAMSQAAGLENGTILSRYVILVFAGLFLMCLNVKSMLESKMVRVSWFIWIWIVVYYLITYAFFGKRAMMGDVRSIAISLAAIMIGWQFDLDEKRFRVLLLAFAGLTLFVGLMQVFTNVGGFVIRDQYHTDNKNSLGVMLATSLIVFFFIGLNQPKVGLIRISMIALCLLTFVVLLTIRARAATLTSIIIFLFVLCERYKGKNLLLYLILGLFFVVIAFLVLPSEMKEYVYNSFFQNYEGGDITAGRAWRNAAAFRFLSDHIFLGNLNADADIAQIHNYPLNRTYQFGVVFVFPILLVYLYLLVEIFVKTIKSDSKDLKNIGCYLLLIPFIISMVEPTFPFGPGTATVVNFLVFGLALRHSNNAKQGLITDA